MAASVDSQTHDILSQIHGLSSQAEIERVYDQWAAKYDADVGEVEYVGPLLAAQTVVTEGGDKGRILDAGCGTGLVGKALAQAGAKNIDGIDLSPGMLAIARKTGVYGDLSTADMSKVLQKHQDQSYDTIVCVGTLTEGHVGPVPALQEFVRIVKKDGLIVSTILDDVFSREGYETEIERLADEGAIQVISTESKPYRIGRNMSNMTARMVILRRK